MENIFFIYENKFDLFIESTAIKMGISTLHEEGGSGSGKTFRFTYKIILNAGAHILWGLINFKPLLILLLYNFASLNLIKCIITTMYNQNMQSHPRITSSSV